MRTSLWGLAKTNLTGFNVEQQNEIVNTEPKKIIHSLEDEQKLVSDLTQKPVDFFQSKVETPIEVTAEIIEEKIVFELIEDEVKVEPMVAKQENDLIAMNEFIRNLDVTFEIVSPIKDIDFTFTTPTVNNQKSSEPQHFVKEEEQITFSFDLPIAKPIENRVEDERIIFDLSSETKDIKVNEPIEFVPVTELNENGIIKYSLEEYMEIENDLLGSKPAALVEQEPIEESLNFTMKVAEPSKPTYATHTDDISPVEMTIEETLKLRADERRRKLKDFNYKFHNNPSRVEELEKEPAYKRLGVDLTENRNLNNNSRMSLGTDSNDDMQLRSNNSFLHDNVD
jgi:cell division protein FtsZ